jgi:hypothetical protein
MNMKMHIAVAAISAIAASFAQEAAPESDASIASATVGVEVAASEISSDDAAVMNKNVTTHVKTTARSKVKDDIKAYCKECGITIGEVTPKDAIYIEGVERVAANVASPDFTRSRVMTYSKAYTRAVAAYVMDKCGTTLASQFDEYFSDQGSDRLTPSKTFKDTLGRIEDKMAQLAEAKLDAGLRAMGVEPAGSLQERRILAKNSLVKRTLSKAIGSAAGLLPVQTFEGWDDAGKYAIGCVIRGGAETETIAECLRDKRRPFIRRPEAGLSVEDAMPTDEEMVSQFGVRLFFDKNGVPALLSFGQWGSAYTGNDEDMAEDAMDHALRQAKAEADDQLTMFINSSITLEMESNRGEIKENAVVFDANGVPTEESVRKYVDNIMESSKQKGSDTMIGRSTVCEKVIKHHSGHDLAVVVRLWSFDKYDAMKRIIDKPRNPPPPPSVKPANPVGPAGKRRGRSYDF